MRSLILLASLLASVAASARPARVDPEKKEMRAAFDEATTEYNLGHYEKALAAFERGYRVRNDPAFLFNIAQCYRQLHRPVEASRSYRAFLRETPEAPQRVEVERLIIAMDEEAARAAASTPTVAPAPLAPTPVPAPVVEAKPSITEPPPPPPKKKRTALWVGLGVAGGVVLAGAAVGLGVGLTRGGGAPSASLGNMSVTFK